MEQTSKDIVNPRQKLYFLYFIIFTIIILVVFTIIIIGTFWGYDVQIKKIEAFYQSQMHKITQVQPQINQYDPIKGLPDAKVTIIEYSDIFCPSCQDLQNNLLALEKLYTNKIRFVYKALPISSFPENRPALNAAYCAWEQNNFWPYKDLLYENPDLLNHQKYLEYAADLKLDLTKFNQCLAANKYDTILVRNLADALSLQIYSIPTLYINETKVEGVFSFATLKSMIDQRLK